MQTGGSQNGVRHWGLGLPSLSVKANDWGNSRSPFPIRFSVSAHGHQDSCRLLKPSTPNPKPDPFRIASSSFIVGAEDSKKTPCKGAVLHLFSQQVCRSERSLLRMARRHKGLPTINGEEPYLRISVSCLPITPDRTATRSLLDRQPRTPRLAGFLPGGPMNISQPSLAPDCYHGPDTRPRRSRLVPDHCRGHRRALRGAGTGVSRHGQSS